MLVVMFLLVFKLVDTIRVESDAGNDVVFLLGLKHNHIITKVFGSNS